MDLALALHQLVHTVDDQAATLLKPLGVSLRQHTALMVLQANPGLQGAQLAAALQITPAATTGLVKTLRSQGWVSDHSDAGSGNRLQLELTAHGRETLRRTTAALGTSLDEFVRRSGHDPAALTATLVHLNQLLLTDPKD